MQKIWLQALSLPLCLLSFHVRALSIRAWVLSIRRSRRLYGVWSKHHLRRQCIIAYVHAYTAALSVVNGVCNCLKLNLINKFFAGCLVSHNDTLHQYAPAKLNIYLEITKKKAKKVYEIYFSLILTTDYADMHGELRDFRKDF